MSDDIYYRFMNHMKSTNNPVWFSIANANEIDLPGVTNPDQVNWEGLSRLLVRNLLAWSHDVNMHAIFFSDWLKEKCIMQTFNLLSLGRGEDDALYNFASTVAHEFLDYLWSQFEGDYKAMPGGICPHCRTPLPPRSGYYVSGVGPEHDWTLEVRRSCYTCHREWIEIYELAGVVIPEKEVRGGA